MTNKKYVVVLRHGPTHSNESINYDSFVKFVGELVVYLNNFLVSKGLDIKTITPKIYASPYTRCMDTAKLIASYLQVIRNNKKVITKSNSGITRWDMKNETREKSIERARTYGNHIFSKINSIENDEIFIYISHSSIIPALISGIVGKNLKKFKLHTASLSIINANTRELEVFNKSFRS
jgi:broad specificity phosphatase PhoE